MAITYWLIDATPYRLRYKCYYNNEAPALATIPNDGGVTPDLRTDALNGAGPGAGGIPINNLLRARLWGYPVPSAGVLAAGALTQAQARAIMNSDDAASAVLVNDLMPRAVTTITAMTAALAWAADWNIDAQGDPVCEVRCQAGAGAGYATLDIWVRHSEPL